MVRLWPAQCRSVLNLSTVATLVHTVRNVPLKPSTLHCYVINVILVVINHNVNISFLMVLGTGVEEGLTASMPREMASDGT